MIREISSFQWPSIRGQGRAGAGARSVPPPQAPAVIPPLGESVVGGFAPFPATKIHDPLHAKCLVLDNGETKILLPESDEEVAALEADEHIAKLSKAWMRFPPERPVTYDLTRAEVQRRYLPRQVLTVGDEDYNLYLDARDARYRSGEIVLETPYHANRQVIDLAHPATDITLEGRDYRVFNNLMLGNLIFSTMDEHRWLPAVEVQSAMLNPRGVMINGTRVFPFPRASALVEEETGAYHLVNSSSRLRIDGKPVVAHPLESSESGRGLILVEALSWPVWGEVQAASATVAARFAPAESPPTATRAASTPKADCGWVRSPPTGPWSDVPRSDEPFPCSPPQGEGRVGQPAGQALLVTPFQFIIQQQGQEFHRPQVTLDGLGRPSFQG